MCVCVCVCVCVCGGKNIKSNDFTRVFLKINSKNNCSENFFKCGFRQDANLKECLL